MNKIVYFSERAWKPRRYDLRAEMDSVMQHSRVRAGARPNIVLLVPTPLGDCPIPGDFFWNLQAHETFMMNHPDRIAGDPVCAYCKKRGRLAHGSAWQLCRNCELDRGLNLPEPWPKCRVCKLVFPNSSAGEFSRGAWVYPSANEQDLCECCALESRFGGDQYEMAAAVVVPDRGLRRILQSSKYRRPFSVKSLENYAASLGWTRGAVPFELLRLHRIPMVAMATAILNQSRRDVAHVLQRENEIDALAERDGWREAS